MRAGACTVQQTLTTEAASVLKHSLSLARRRGHAQVTPLHVAATLLSSRSSLLRRACLKSQPQQHQASHPLQCRALELCFNVALNRLPTTPGPLLHGQPSLSNALIAALKRAQAHQRRGCIEQQQQQPLLTIKVELEQLIISILDDPSVSRVMREAGFSSTAVKNNVEDSSASSVFQCYNSSGAGGVFSSPCSPSAAETQREIINPSSFWQTHFLTYSSEQNPVLFSPQNKVPTINITDHSSSVKEDIKLVLEVLLRKKRRNTVIVGDSVSTTEGFVGVLMERVEIGEVPEELKSAHLIKFQFAPVALRFMKREDVEMNLLELKRKVESLASGGRGAIIYAGDLKWTVEAAVSNGEISGYSPVDHLVAEMGRLVSEYCNKNTKVWLMATASYQTYMRCQMRQPPLEIQWGLQAVSVPSGGLGLSLHASSVHDSRITFSQSPSQELETKPFSKEGQDHRLTCCAECTSNFEKEAAFFKSGHHKLLPSWLQPQGAEAPQKDELGELRRKWNRLCHSLHQGRPSQNQLKSSSLFNNQSLIGKSYSYASSYPWWTTHNTISPSANSISFTDSASKPAHSSLPRFRRQQSCSTIEFNFGSGSVPRHQPAESSLDSLKNTQGKEVKITLALGNSLFSEKSEGNVKRDDMCKKLRENVPWQSDTIPAIVEVLMDSKSGKKETWLLIQGNDIVGKRRLAQAIAESIFGSADLFLHMNMRKKENEETPCSEILIRALKNQEKLVVLVEDVDLADTQFLKFLAEGLETGLHQENFGQAIFILTKGDSGSNAYGKKEEDSVIQMVLKLNETIPVLGTPNSSHQKRKSEWDSSNKIKSPKIDEKEDESSGNAENLNINSMKSISISRQSSFNTLDLNIRANEDDDESPISSDLTLETTTLGFLESIENRFVFDRNPAGDREIREVLLSKIKGSLEEFFGDQNVVNFRVEERVLEEMVIGCGYFLNSLFEKWLKDIFQRSLEKIKNGGKEGIEVRLCLGSKTERENGYMGSILPGKIHVCFME